MSLGEYRPSEFEEKLANEWIEKKYFTPNKEKVLKGERKKFSLVLPPPNVTGALHIGHALNATMQDILCRYKKLKGYEICWIPGTDHAGIATQFMVEKELAKEGKTRYDLGREKFLERVWKWKEKYGNTIINQLKKLGVACDWTRQRFTMDEGFYKLVRKVFVKLYEDGLMYRGLRLINWCPRCKTALSDLEVEFDEKPEKGKLYYFRYPLKLSEEEKRELQKLEEEFNKKLENLSEEEREKLEEERPWTKPYIVIATTRPETMLGDVAVAVNPNDKRYKHLIGKKLILPLVNREIPIIADDFVDASFGTGCVKITPAHDFEDYEVGKRHNLPLIKVLDEDAKISKAKYMDYDGNILREEDLPYEGLDRYKAREQIVKDLEKQNLLEKIEDYKLLAGKCYRCKTTVEPMLSKQWFLKLSKETDNGIGFEKIVKPAIDAVKNDITKFIPKEWEKTYFNWLENIKDWCVSRQLWWGHRIPAYYCQDCGETIVSEEEVKECPKCKSKNIKQDEDVLDTWFSSALWPFGTLMYLKETKKLSEDLKKVVDKLLEKENSYIKEFSKEFDVSDYFAFYPTDILVTGFDIIFFWVARMMMMGLYFTKKVPFYNVLVHMLVRDEKGHKMSKTKGNVIDPLDVIKNYGADSLRWTLASLASPGRDIRLSFKLIETASHFMNKIWNIAKYIFGVYENSNKLDFSDGYKYLSYEDKWILKEFNKLLENFEKYINQYRFDEASKHLNKFIWDTFADWYVELSKNKAYKGSEEEKKAALWTLFEVFKRFLILLSTIAPFISDYLYRKLPNKEKESIILETFPEKFKVEESEDFEEIIKFITEIRNLKSTLGIPPSSKIDIFVSAKGISKDIFEKLKDSISKLAKVNISFTDRDLDLPCLKYKNFKIYLNLKEKINISEQIKLLEKKLEKLNKDLKRVEGKLNNKNFLEKAPKEVIEKAQKEKEEILLEIEKINQALNLIR